MPPRASPARAAALDLLGGVLGDGVPLNDQTDRLEKLSPTDRAAASRVVLAALRDLDAIDALLAGLIRKAPPQRVRNILRLGAAELASGGAPHAVVGEAVALAAANRKTAAAKGLVNAVLRKLPDAMAESWADRRPTRLPPWLRTPLVHTWGKPAVNAMEQVFATVPPVDLTPRDPQGTEALAAATGGTALPTGSVRLPAGRQISALDGYADGAFWVQDAAAALPVRLLGDLTGQSALDMCAAPGGKTLQLAAQGAQVTALDLSRNRLARVEENLARTDLTASLHAQDALEHRGAYDVVLLDAPCSATGTLRRHPDLPHVRDGSALDALTGVQAALLDHAVGLLKPGGRLVYATCSLLPEEGEAQAEAALQRHPALHLALPEVPWIEEAWRSPAGGLRLRPDFWADRGGMDGFYVTVLRKAQDGVHVGDDLDGQPG